MLPFLKHSKEASVSMPSDSIKRKSDDEESEDYDSLESAAEDLHSAIKSGDTKGIAMALRAAFDILDSEPHFEGQHTNEDE